MTYTDEEIDDLLQTPKKPVGDRTDLPPLRDSGMHARATALFQGDDGNEFKVLLRRSRANALDFSVILAVRVPGSNRWFRRKVCRQIEVMPEGIGRYRVVTPFEFDDGDGLVIVLKRQGSGWLLTDEAHTFMRLTYDIDKADLHRGTRQKLISNALDMFGVEDRDGELVMPVPDERFGDALFSFVQAILRIFDVNYLSRERVLSTFKDDFRGFLKEWIPAERRVFDWRDPEADPQGNYAVDCRVNGIERPLFIYGSASDHQTNAATIAIHQFERWGKQFSTLGVFEDQEKIARKVLARFTDVCDRQYSSLGANRERIETFINQAVAG